MTNSKKPKVAILMGSESDLAVMQKASDTLKRLGVEHRMAVASAHRTPKLVHDLVASAENEGVEVFIAAAGMAAHLGGVVASQTVKPVIGVPLNSKLDGLDALLATVQMPRGVPVATVAIDGAENAATLAAQILATSDGKLAERLAAERATNRASLTEKAKAMWEAAA